MFDPDDICEETKKAHVPDWKTVSTNFDGEDLYVDVNCKDCGKSGCVGTHKTLAAGICW